MSKLDHKKLSLESLYNDFISDEKGYQFATVKGDNQETNGVVSVISNQIIELEMQRDKLLEVLERIKSLSKKHPKDPIACANDAYMIAGLAIAIAKGGEE